MQHKMAWKMKAEILEMRDKGVVRDLLAMPALA